MSLLSIIDAYIEKHGITSSAFGSFAMGDPGFYRKVSIGHNFKTTTLETCRQWLADNPDGGKIPKARVAEIRQPRKRVAECYKAPVSGISRQPERIDLDALCRVDRDPCVYCGVRGDFGCAHNQRAAA